MVAVPDATGTNSGAAQQLGKQLRSDQHFNMRNGTQSEREPFIKQLNDILRANGKTLYASRPPPVLSDIEQLLPLSSPDVHKAELLKKTAEYVNGTSWVYHLARAAFDMTGAMEKSDNDYIDETFADDNLGIYSGHELLNWALAFTDPAKPTVQRALLKEWTNQRLTKCTIKNVQAVLSRLLVLYKSISDFDDYSKSLDKFVNHVCGVVIEPYDNGIRNEQLLFIVSFLRSGMANQSDYMSNGNAMLTQLTNQLTEQCWLAGSDTDVETHGAADAPMVMAAGISGGGAPDQPKQEPKKPRYENNCPCCPAHACQAAKWTNSSSVSQTGRRARRHREKRMQHQPSICPPQSRV